MTDLQEIKAHRGETSIGYNPHRFVELFGGTLVPVYNYEPDPQTFRCGYYYNARVNQLYKKLSTTGDAIFYFWRAVSEAS